MQQKISVSDERENILDRYENQFNSINKTEDLESIFDKRVPDKGSFEKQWHSVKAVL